MLIECPECKKQVSDKAISCPNCGYPISSAQNTSRRRKLPSRMRLPNGFGRITEIKGRNLRKPFRAMISDGKDSTGHPIGRLLEPQAYFSSYQEAYEALLEYHKNPYDYENNITMDELYEKWYEFHSKRISDSRKYQIDSSWKYCTELIGPKQVQAVRTPELKRLLDDGYKTVNGRKVYPTDNVRNIMKYTLSLMFDYAVEYGYTDKNYAREIRSGYGTDEAENPHIVYPKEELDTLWEYAGKDLAVDMILVQCYMGWRPGELCDLKLNNINMSEWTIIGGSKTAAGKGREAVIHEYIRPIVRKHYDEALMSGCNYLFIKDKKRVQYQVFADYFRETLTRLKIMGEHRPHDGRKTFVTLAKAAGVDEYAIKIQVGHAIKDITERVYTNRDIKWLHKEIGKIDPGRKISVL